MIGGGAFSPGEPEPLPARSSTRCSHGGDHYLLLADYASYVACQDARREHLPRRGRVDAKSILNVAGMGKFSSDRTIRQYADEIWHVAPTRVE